MFFNHIKYLIWQYMPVKFIKDSISKKWRYEIELWEQYVNWRDMPEHMRNIVLRERTQRKSGRY